MEAEVAAEVAEPAAVVIALSRSPRSLAIVVAVVALLAALVSDNAAAVALEAALVSELDALLALVEAADALLAAAEAEILKAMAEECNGPVTGLTEIVTGNYGRIVTNMKTEV